MNKLRLFLGIGSLILAAVLATLYFTLPSDSMMFMVGDTNLPWVPAVIFFILGMWLLATAGLGRAGEELYEPTEAEQSAEPEGAGEAEQFAASQEPGEAEERAEQKEQPEPETVVDPWHAALNKRLETIAWGMFLIIWGCFMFVPKTVVSEGVWSIWVGLIMLGLNVMRYFNGLRMSGFTTVLGIIALIGGVLQLFGVQGIEGALLLIILGAYLIVKPRLDQRQLFGKAEQA